MALQSQPRAGVVPFRFRAVTPVSPPYHNRKQGNQHCLGRSLEACWACPKLSAPVLDLPLRPMSLSVSKYWVMSSSSITSRLFTSLTSLCKQLLRNGRALLGVASKHVGAHWGSPAVHVADLALEAIGCEKHGAQAGLGKCANNTSCMQPTCAAVKNRPIGHPAEQQKHQLPTWKVCTLSRRPAMMACKQQQVQPKGQLVSGRGGGGTADASHARCRAAADSDSMRCWQLDWAGGRRAAYNALRGASLLY